MSKKAIGARLRRKEDDRFLHGRGQYIGDIRFPRMRDVAFVRSTVAHARLTGHAQRRAKSREDAGQRLRDLSAAQWKSGVAAWLGWLFDGLDMHLYTLVAAPFVAQLIAAQSTTDPMV